MAGQQAAELVIARQPQIESLAKSERSLRKSPRLRPYQNEVKPSAGFIAAAAAAKDGLRGKAIGRRGAKTLA
jgi:hypothetical protein